ncbi:MAG: hypothetical protein ACQKBY_11520 [Verrucomicrobiales bacterium]
MFIPVHQRAHARSDDSLPWQSITHDWYHKALDKPARFLFRLDAKFLHFTCHHAEKALPHPEARAGEFRAELWKYDVGEFFLADPRSGRYLEFNLSPNGAWWAALFDAPRRISAQECELGRVRASGEIGESSWLAQASIPRQALEKLFPDWSDLRLNATFILGSPEQIFVSAADLKAVKPDFHRPAHFPRLRLVGAGA